MADTYGRMSNASFLHLLLSSACGAWERETVESKGYQSYHLDLHCVTFTVHARKIGQTWDIIDVIVEDA